MAYEPILWQDHVVERPHTYTHVNNPDGSETYTPAPGEIIRQGTPQSATNFGHMDFGILDEHIASSLTEIARRQDEWRIVELEKATIQETGIVTRQNTVGFPFNNSSQSVALVNVRDNLNYVVVIVKVEASGNVGEIEITDRQVNGFKIGYTGSAPQAQITYAVIGGYEK
ncbi:MAG: hypothetical protein IKN04_18295 [Clostridia bacterium]|nr:hypothetical protein [Clostridia bacterium]